MKLCCDDNSDVNQTSEAEREKDHLVKGLSWNHHM
jgi:hypothetical protein